MHARQAFVGSHSITRPMIPNTTGIQFVRWFLLFMSLLGVYGGLIRKEISFRHLPGRRRTWSIHGSQAQAVGFIYLLAALAFAFSAWYCLFGLVFAASVSWFFSLSGPSEP
jgi:hypothetical protein